MSRVISSQWPGNPLASTVRDACRAAMKPYVPDPLVGRAIRLDGDVAADMTEAEAAINGLNAGAFALADTEALARLLLRAESVDSSRIEGLGVGARKLVRAEGGRDSQFPTESTSRAAAARGQLRMPNRPLAGCDQPIRGDPPSS